MKKNLRFVLVTVMTALTVVFCAASPLLPLQGGMTAYAAGEFTINNGVLVDYSGSGGKVTIPNTVTRIDNWAFYNKPGVTSVVIPTSVKSIGDYAFAYCTGLTAVNIPHSVTEIGERCFSECASLKSVTLSPSVKTLGDMVFWGCGNLASITVESGNPSFSSQNGILYNAGKTTVLLCPQAKTGAVTLPSTVTKIGRLAFADCAGITGVTLPASLKTIEEGAFEFCSGIPSLTIPDSVTTIGSYAFEWCSAAASLKMSASVVTIGNYAFTGCSGVKSITLPATLKTIGEGAFWGCAGLTGITIPASVTSIGRAAFYSLNHCAAFTVDSGSQNFCSVGGALYDKNQTRLLACPCAKTGEITLPSTVKTLDDYAFANCWNLTAIHLPSSLTSIGANAFAGCTNITSLTIPVSVKRIGNGAFDSCIRLQTVNYAGTAQQWNKLLTDENGVAIDTHLPDTAVMQYNYTPASTLSITTQPVSKTIAKGSAVTLSLKASGSGLQYQWYFKKAGQTSFSVWSGRTHASETVTPNDTWDGIQLYCKITDGAGVSLNSNTVTVKFSSLKITAQPTSRTVAKGSSTTFTVKASGSGLKYQWYFKKKGQTSFSVWNGRTHASETVSPNDTWDGIQLYCKITDSAGASLQSNTVTLKFGTPLKITAQPVGKVLKKGGSVTLSVKAAGTGLKYQWYFKKQGQTSFSAWNGRIHASETVTPNDTWDGIQLYCRITDGAGASVKSSTVTIRFGTPLAITLQPSGRTVTAGHSTTLSLKAQGTGLQYQWYFKKKGQTSFTAWNGRTHASETVTPNDTWDGIQLYCVVSDAVGDSVKSAVITVTLQ